MPAMKQVNASVSLLPFVAFLEQKIAEKDNVRMPFFQYILDRIQSFPGWDTEITLEKSKQYTEIFELIYFTLSAPVTDENEEVWALGLPLSPHLFFGTNAFYNLISNKDGKLNANLLNGHDRKFRAAERIKIIYSVIMKKLYGFSSDIKNEIIHSFLDGHTGLSKYYRIAFDTQFITIEYDGPLPEVKFPSLQSNSYDETESLAFLESILPLDKFRFKGFSILHITDITAEYAIDHIKDVIVNLSPEQDVYQDITHSLKTLLGNHEVDIKLFPIFKVNGQLVMDSFEGIEAHLSEECARYGFSKKVYIDSVIDYVQNPSLIFYQDISELRNEELKIMPLLRNMGVRSVAIIPIFFQKKIVGILELFSKEKNKLDPQNLSRLNQAIPLLEQLLQTAIDDFDITLDNIVKEKFTSLQPSVQWRFNEAAWHYLQQKRMKKEVDIEHVYFPDVYPLYGAIDIRNSTMERNIALRSDMYSQLELLTEVLRNMKTRIDLDLLDELIYKTGKWCRQINEFITSEDEFRLALFLENEVNPFLSHFRQSEHGFEEMIDVYFQAAGPEGPAFANRRELEHALQQINITIGTALEKMNTKIQEIYPCYFEKFRSDGIEYDIYIGQSITPQKVFDPLYLKNLRLWQLSSMAEIAGQTQSLVPRLSKKLETTQLIFIHTHSIDISFRNDERRFDVEGTYNIRYEMVKKRIDKVHIKNSSERLTQPGKIALVYFHQKDTEEYVSYIRYLQEQHILNDDLEYLDLEDLQGISGLKALRIGVTMDVS